MFLRNHAFTVLWLALLAAIPSGFAKNSTNCRVPAPAKVLFPESLARTRERALLYNARFGLLKKWGNFSVVQDVTCSFTLKKTGEIIDPVLIETGGSKLVDDSVIKLLKQNGPLDVDKNFPESLKVLVRFRHYPSLELKIADPA